MYLFDIHLILIPFPIQHFITQNPSIISDESPQDLAHSLENIFDFNRMKDYICVIIFVRFLVRGTKQNKKWKVLTSRYVDASQMHPDVLGLLYPNALNYPKPGHPPSIPQYSRPFPTHSPTPLLRPQTPHPPSLLKQVYDIPLWLTQSRACNYPPGKVRKSGQGPAGGVRQGGPGGGGGGHCLGSRRRLVRAGTIRKYCAAIGGLLNFVDWSILNVPCELTTNPKFTDKILHVINRHTCTDSSFYSFSFCYSNS